MNIIDFQKMKNINEKITMVTCYDYTSAKIVDQSNVDCILVGDSLAMVMHGHSTTLPIDVDIMALHVQAVAKGISKKFIIGDLPFLSYRESVEQSMRAVKKIMQAGAHAVKLEGAIGNLALIEHIVNSGVPVMGHLGMTPQSVYQLGGFKVQGKQASQAQQIKTQAEQLQSAGCFAIVLECIPSELANTITENLQVPTIGIGSGPHTSGQVLVWQDLLGMNMDLQPKFLKKYLNGFELIKTALNNYHEEVKGVVYPDQIEHVY